MRLHVLHQGLYSLSGKTSYRKISWSLEAARFGFKLFQSLWNLAGTSAALLPRCLSNFRAIRPLQHPISRLRDFTRFGGKTSYRLVNRGPGFTANYPTNNVSGNRSSELPLCWYAIRWTNPIQYLFHGEIHGMFRMILILFPVFRLHFPVHFVYRSICHHIITTILYCNGYKRNYLVIMRDYMSNS